MLIQTVNFLDMCVCVCVCACVRACVRVCAPARAPYSFSIVDTRDKGELKRMFTSNCMYHRLQRLLGRSRKRRYPITVYHGAGGPPGDPLQTGEGNKSLAACSFCLSSTALLFGPSHSAGSDGLWPNANTFPHYLVRIFPLIIS